MFVFSLPEKSFFWIFFIAASYTFSLFMLDTQIDVISVSTSEGSVVIIPLTKRPRIWHPQIKLNGFS